MNPRRQPAGPGDWDGWLLVALACFIAGVVLLVVTWYHVSGSALVAEQLPYLASGGLGGLALIVGGVGALVAGRVDRVDARLRELVSAITEAEDSTGSGEPAAPEGNAGSHLVLVVTGGTTRTYHRPGCRLTADRDVDRLTEDEARRRGLTACPICH